MCEHHLSKGIGSDATAGTLEASRPMRTPAQRKRAKAFMRDVTRVLRSLFSELWEILDDMATARGERLPSLRSVATVRKATYPEDIQAIAALFNAATPEEMRALNALFQSFGLDMREAFQRNLDITYQEGLDEAYELMAQYAGRQDPELFGTVAKTYPFSRQSSFYQAFAPRALNLARDKVTIQMRDRIYGILGNGISTGRNWSEMATQLYQELGTGRRGRYHWVRIVRTEMGFAYEQSQYERYQNAGMQYVRRSLANGACPICQGLAGVWEASQAPPLIAHPNCRCRYIPFYRLPRGANPRNPSEVSNLVDQIQRP